jgi:hypothetical protein
MNIAFDTLEYTDKLVAAGLDERQARVQAQALRDIVVEKIITKDDMRAEVALLRKELHSEVSLLRKDMEAMGSELRKELHSEVSLLRKDMNMLFYRLVGSIGGMLLITAGVVSKLAGLF